MEYWYLWVIFILLVIVTVIVLKKASAALSLHNNDRQALIKELERLKELKDKYSDLTDEKINAAEPSELLQGVTAVLQARVEKSENPNAVFNSFNEPQKNIYTLNYFIEDVRESLSFFFKNNGEPLISVAHKALFDAGCEELSALCKAEFSMYDENNEEVSLSEEKLRETDVLFRDVYSEEELLKKIKAYIKENAGSFNRNDG